MTILRSAALLVTAVSLQLSLPSYAQEAPKRQDPQERQILKVAKQSATIAGGATYCKLDPDDIEEFIGKAQARLALLARNDYQKVLGRIEFKNILDATSAREPRAGCEEFEDQFNTILRESR